MNERIKELRNALGLTQKEFGDRIGIKRNTIATYEAGRNEPISSVISLICKEFGVNENWLRTGAGGNRAMFNRDQPDALLKLKNEFNLSDADLILVERFLKLNKFQRDAVTDYVRQVAEAFVEKEREEMTIEAAEAAYREALNIAPPTKSIASNITDDTAEDDNLAGAT